MATNDHLKLTYEIVRIAQPKTGVHLYNVEVLFKMDDREWRKIIHIAMERPMSPEEFERELRKADIMPNENDDHMIYLREEIGKPKPIEIVVVSKDQKSAKKI